MKKIFIILFLFLLPLVNAGIFTNDMVYIESSSISSGSINTSYLNQTYYNISYINTHYYNQTYINNHYLNATTILTHYYNMSYISTHTSSGSSKYNSSLWFYRQNYINSNGTYSINLSKSITVKDNITVPRVLTNNITFKTGNLYISDATDPTMRLDQKNNVNFTKNITVKNRIWGYNATFIGEGQKNDTAPVRIWNMAKKNSTLILELINNNVTKAFDNQDCGMIQWSAWNESRLQNYSQTRMCVNDHTRATEDATLSFRVRTAGAWTVPLSLTGTTATTTTLAATTVSGAAGTFTQYALIGGSTTAGTSTAIKMGGQSTAYRVATQNTSTFALTASYSAASEIIVPKWSEAASGNHNIIAGTAYIKGKTPIVAAAGTVGNTSMIYIEDVMNATVSGFNYAIYVRNGATRLNGNVTIGLGMKFLTRTQATIEACNANSNGTYSKNQNGPIYCNGVKWRNVSLGS
jgi:hypothetical protein